MKRSFRSLLGVTLLEIMLVLAIAAMVILMSVRYYQSASLNQKINASVSHVLGIIAAGESYLGNTGDLTAFNSAAAGPYLPGAVMPKSPWGGPITVKGTGPNTYTIGIPNVPTAGGCPQLLNLLTSQNTKIKGSDCSAITVTE